VNGARWWPVALVAVLGLTVLVNVAVYWKANSDPSFAVEPDYYQRAVDWDSTVAARQRSDALQWRADVRLAPPADGQAAITVTLAGHDGAPVDSVDVQVEASFNGDGARIYTRHLTPSGRGTYTGRIPSTEQGLWRVDLTAARGAEHFVERATVDNGAPRAP